MKNGRIFDIWRALAEGLRAFILALAAAVSLFGDRF